MGAKATLVVMGVRAVESDASVEAWVIGSGASMGGARVLAVLRCELGQLQVAAWLGASRGTA
jgi:hypothetical protein